MVAGRKDYGRDKGDRRQTGIESGRGMQETEKLSPLPRNARCTPYIGQMSCLNIVNVFLEEASKSLSSVSTNLGAESHEYENGIKPQ